MSKGLFSLKTVIDFLVEIIYSKNNLFLLQNHDKALNHDNSLKRELFQAKKESHQYILFDSISFYLIQK